MSAKSQARYFYCLDLIEHKQLNGSDSVNKVTLFT